MLPVIISMYAVYNAWSYRLIDVQHAIREENVKDTFKKASSCIDFNQLLFRENNMWGIDSWRIPDYTIYFNKEPTLSSIFNTLETEHMSYSYTSSTTKRPDNVTNLQASSPLYPLWQMFQHSSSIIARHEALCQTLRFVARSQVLKSFCSCQIHSRPPLCCDMPYSLLG